MILKYRSKEMQKPNKKEIAAVRQRLEEEGAMKRRRERSDLVIEG